MIQFYEFFARYIGWRWLVRLLVIALLVGAYWFLAPLLEIDGARPLAEPWARIGLPLGLVALYLLIRIYPGARLRWEKHQLAQRGITATDSMDNMAVLERLAVMERFEAVAEVLGPRAQAGATAADAYGTPWYLMLGLPGGGRTTLLARAELDFPLHQPATGGADQPCDIWVSRRAVVVDAAGRLALQDSAPEQDEAGWRTLLQMLTRQRPRRPVNAVLLAVPVDALLGDDDGRRRRLAETLRRRVQEACSQFGIRLPVYLIVTRCDLVAGFSEFFETRDVDEREQIWGFSLPLERTMAGEAMIRRIEAEAAALTERVEAQVAPRLHSERDAARRRLIANFVVQFRLVQQELSRFAAEFLRGDHNSAAPPLRGVFLTSATREDFDPRSLFGLVAEPFTLDPARVPLPLHPERSFFTAGLFSDAILPEADLAGTNRAVEAGLVSRHMLQYGTAGLILVATAGLWAQAYERHIDHLAVLDGAMQTVAAALGQARGQSDLNAVFAPLADLRAASAGYLAPGLLPAVLDLGMTPDSAVARDLDAIHRAVLQREFQPRAAELARQTLAGLLNGNDLRAVHHALRVYLMLCTPARANATLLQGWAAQIGQSKLALFPEQNRIFQRHMEDLLGVGLQPLTPEPVTVGQARRMLLRSTPATQVYEELKRVASTAGLRDFRIPLTGLPTSSAAAGAVSMGSDVLETAMVVPGFYTSEGFYQVFLKQLPGLSTGSVEDDWMFDASSIMAVSTSNADLVNQVTDLYVRDYIAAWQKFLRSIEFYGFMTLSEAAQALDYLSAADSPIRTILVSLRNNVDLPVPAPPQPAANAAAAASPRRGSLTDRVFDAGATLAASQLQPEAAAAPAMPPPLPPQVTGANWPGTRIAAPFRSLTDLVVENGSRTAGIEGVLGAVSSLAGTAKSVVLSSDPPRAAYQMALARLGVRPGQQADSITLVRMAADRQPEPVRQWLTRLAGETWAAAMAEARAAIAQSWEQEVMPEWRRSVRDRYPLFREGGTEIPLKDFATFFGPAGVVDKFVQDRLAAFIDMSGTRWSNRRVDGESIELSASALWQLQQAAMIRQAFFAQGNGTMPSVRFSLRPTMLDSRATQWQLVSGAETITYRHEPPRARKLQWPGETGFGPLRMSVTDIENRSWTLEKDGVWSLYRLLDEARIRMSTSGDRYQMDIALNGLTATIELITETAGPNPLDLRLLRDLRLPEHLQ